MAFISRKQQVESGIVHGEPRTFVAPTPAPPVQPPPNCCNKLQQLYDFVAPTLAPPVQPPPATLPPSTALTPVAPIAPRALIDSHNRLIDVYAAQAKQAAKAGEVLPPADGSAPRGYSNSSELQARNRRFYVAIGAMVGVAAMGIAGLVQIAAAAGIVGQSWQLPMWLGLTGIAAMLIIQSTYGNEARLSPENIELVRLENEFAIAHMDAETRQMAIKLAGQIDRERVRLEREQAAAQRESNRRLTLETQARIAEQMTRHTVPQNTMNRLNTYRAPVAPVALKAPQTPQKCR